MITKELKDFIHRLCQYGNEDEAFYQNFITELTPYEDIIKELTYYMKHGDFLGEASVAGYSVMDILVWQIDHFKSHMDRGEYDMESNPDRMVLLAFDTLLKMKQNPTDTRLAIQTETGTDLPCFTR
ncbi:MAG: hypothetical protein J6D02_12295 [Lachnospira sp.]|nr:hypothetical protein [Lachnospira sp.]